MEEHISPRGKEQNVRTLCRGPGKPRYTLPLPHTFQTHLSLAPQESSASARLPYLML